MATLSSGAANLKARSGLGTDCNSWYPILAGLVTIFWSMGAVALVAKPMDIPSISGMVTALVNIFIILCLNAWHKEHKFKRTLEKDPGVAKAGVMV